MDNLTIRVFGQLVDVVGSEAIILPFCDNVSELKIALFKSYPDLKEKTFVVAMDHKIVENEALLQVNCSIALLPPFSGG